MRSGTAGFVKCFKSSVFVPTTSNVVAIFFPSCRSIDYDFIDRRRMIKFFEGGKQNGTSIFYCEVPERRKKKGQVVLGSQHLSSSNSPKEAFRV